jgi:hypothetical protein
MSEPTAPSVPAGEQFATGPIPPYFGPMGRSAQTPQPRGSDGGATDADAATPADPAEALGDTPAGATAAGLLPDGAPSAGAPDADAGTAEVPLVAEPGGPGREDPAGVPVAAWALTGNPSSAGSDPTPAPQSGTFPTTPVSTRPTVRARRRDPLTRMGPWAPAAGALFGLVAGLVVVVLLADRADAFGEGLALVFVVVGLTMLGAAGALLADEVRIVRRGAREAAVRPAWVEATANLVNGLTPARLLLASSAFVLFLAAYVGR